MADYVLVEEALSSWREAERLLAELPADSPDRDRVAAVLERSRMAYRSLTAEANVSADMVARNRTVLAEARAVLLSARGTTKTGG